MKGKAPVLGRLAVARVGLLASLLLAACQSAAAPPPPAPASAAAPPAAAAQAAPSRFAPALQQLVDQARGEGKVILFTASVKRTAEQAAQIADGFQTYFGIPTQVELASLGGNIPFMNRLKEEARAGIKPPVDLMSTNAFRLVDMREAGIVHEVDWKALGLPDDLLLINASMPYIELNTRPWIHNTQYVPKAQAPRRFEDLLDPKYKGKIIAPAAVGVFTFIPVAMGDEQAALTFVRRLVTEQQLALAPTLQDTSQRVANGEYWIGYGHDGADLPKRGAPIATAPLPYAGAQDGFVVVKNAAHPAAAALLAYFLVATPEGQRLAEDVLDWDRPRPGEPAEAIVTDPQWLLENGARLERIFKEILGL